MKCGQSWVGSGLQADAPTLHVALRPNSTGHWNLLYLPQGNLGTWESTPQASRSRGLVGTELCSSER